MNPRNLTMGALLVLSMAACDLLPGREAVLFVDLDRVAQQVGRKETIERRVETAREELQQELETAAQQVREQVAAQQARHEEGEADESEDLDRFIAAARQRLEENERVARARLSQLGEQLREQFQAEVGSHARAIAGRRGASAVLTTTTPSVWIEPSVDITAEVSSAMLNDLLVEPVD